MTLNKNKMCQRAEIYYQTLNIQSIEQTAKFNVCLNVKSDKKRITHKYMQLRTLFGSLGGALSLYLGCAVIMLFELLELAIDILVNLWIKRGYKKNLQSRVKDIQI